MTVMQRHLMRREIFGECVMTVSLLKAKPFCPPPKKVNFETDLVQHVIAPRFDSVTTIKFSSNFPTAQPEVMNSSVRGFIKQCDWMRLTRIFSLR